MGRAVLRARGVGTLVLLAALGQAAPAAAQSDSAQTAPARFSGGLALMNTQPLGALATGPGWGVSITGALALDGARRLRIRGDLRAGLYGRDTRTVCLSQTIGCLIQADVNTDYTSFYFGVGPELAVPVLGSLLVLDATAGVGSFGVASSLEGTSDLDSQALFRTNHFSDTFFAWSVGGELRVPVTRDVAVALGTHYLRNGEASYVPEGGVTLNGDGSVNVDVRTTDANQMVLTLGIAVQPRVGWFRDPAEQP